MIKAGIVGGTGYAGQNLVWLLNNHDQVKIDFICSHNNTNVPFSGVYPNFFGTLQDLCIDMPTAFERLSEIDVLFIALPHGKSYDLSNKALQLGVKVVDLGADFRLRDPAMYELWYDMKHPSDELLSTAVYGLPELHRKEIMEAQLVANPGCYPTASILAAAPLLAKGLVEPQSIIIDAKSGVSGAGRTASIPTLFCESNESIKAYGVTSHRHTPEIEQELSKAAQKELTISFTPHLVPMNRGILATCYGALNKIIEQDALYDLYKRFYEGEPFVRISDGLPETRWVKGTNYCDIGIRVDKRTHRVIAVSAIDNLIKGAAGQAVQNMNILFKFKESKGLDLLAMFP